MNNLKRVLSMALASVMLVGMMAVGAAATNVEDFTDKDEITHTEAVNTLVALNVINGKDDGSYYDPAGSLTRAEMAKLVVFVLHGGKDPVLGVKATPSFTDIKGNWAEQYIEYCYNTGIIAGQGDGTFAPGGTLTGSQAAKMILTAMGYNSDVFHLTGADWEMNTNVEANKAGLYEELEGMDPTTTISRDDAAQLVYNAITSPLMVRSWTQDQTTGVVTESYNLADGNNGRAFNTLLRDKFKGDINVGYLTDFTYDEAKQEWTYTFDASNNFNSGELTASNRFETSGGAAGSKDLKSKEDYTGMFGQQVKVIWKTTTNDVVYGVYTNDSKVVAEGVTGDIGKIDTNSRTVKLDGTAYKFDDNSVTTNRVYNNGDETANGQDVAALKADTSSFRFKAIDNDGDGRVDCFVKTPIYVSKINYINSTSLTVGAPAGSPGSGVAAAPDLVDIDIYEDAEKNDWVIVTPAAYSATGRDTYEKAEVKTDVITGIRDNTGDFAAASDKEYRIDGSWYNKTPLGSNVSASIAINDEVEYVALGSFLYYVKVEQAATTTKDLCMVISARKITTTGDYIDNDSVEAKLLFADGSTKTVKLGKINGKTATFTAYNTSTNSDATKWEAAMTVGGLFTYKVDSDSKYDLTAVPTSSTTGNLAGYKGSTATATYGGKKIGSYELADDATVFVLTKGDAGVADSGNKGKIYSGKELKNAYPDSGDTYGDSTSYGLYTMDGGFNYIKVAVIDGNGAAPVITTGSNYGYLVANAFNTNEDGKTYINYKFWDGSENVEAKEENSDVSLLDTFKSGTLITYDVKDNGDLKNVSVVNATTGVVKGWDGESKIQLDSSSTKITNDTVLLFVDSDAKKGANGTIDSIQIGEDLNDDDVADQANVRYYGVTNESVSLLVVDIKNKMLAAPAITLGASATAAEITAALSSANSVTLNGDATVATRALADGKTLVVNGDATLSGAVTGTKAKLVVNGFADAATSAAYAQTGTVQIKNAATAATVKAVPTAAGKVLILDAATSDSVATADGFFATNGTALNSAVVPAGTYTYYGAGDIKKADGTATSNTAGWYTAIAVAAVITAAG